MNKLITTYCMVFSRSCVLLVVMLCVVECRACVWRCVFALRRLLVLIVYSLTPIRVALAVNGALG